MFENLHEKFKKVQPTFAGAELRFMQIKKIDSAFP